MHLCEDIKYNLPQEHDKELIGKLSKHFSLSPIIVQILLNRGYRIEESIQDFLFPSLTNLFDPFLFNDMDKATTRILKAIQEREPFLVYGDYDVDGVSSISLLLRNLIRLNADVYYYTPDRIKEGYGISQTGIESIERKGFKLVITVDCGINAGDKLKYASQNGIDVIVTDHHTPRMDFEDAFAVINPKVESERYPFNELAGVGVAFKMLQGLYMKLGRSPHELFSDLDLVALGTVADIVSLTGENRLLVKKGIEVLNRTKKTGLQALIQRSGLKCGDIGSGEISFILAPRINAAGRIGSAGEAVGLLLTEDRDKAWRYATYMEEINRERQKYHEKVIKDSIEIIEDRGYDKGVGGIVIARDDWHEGVVGIAASKIAERYFRPTILISTAGNLGKGSGRSIKAFYLLDALDECSEYLHKYGGHRYAAGISIEKDMIDDFRRAFDNIVKEHLDIDALRKEIDIDVEISFQNLSTQFVSELKKLEPFGYDNRRPIFLTRKIDFVGYPRIVGNNHLKIKARDRESVLDTIGFGKGALASKLEIGKPIYDICYRVKENRYRGRKNINLHILHIGKSVI
jgi:single-stranded-DNA-specific exonuclease